MGGMTDDYLAAWDAFAIPFDAEVPLVSADIVRLMSLDNPKDHASRERSDGEVITFPGRNNALASLAGSMRRRGMMQPEVEAALLAINIDRVDPPLDVSDVRAIAASVCRYDAGDLALKRVERGAATEATEASFITQTLKEICELPSQGYQQLLGPFVYRGLRTLVGAATGEGKTTFVMWMVKAIIDGDAFLGYKGIGPDEDGKKPIILIIDAEQSVPDIQRLALETGMVGSEHVHYISVPDGMHLGDGTPDSVQLEQIIALLRPDVLIVDPAYKVASIDSNNERDVVDLMRLFDRWRTEYGFAFVMPVHTRKGDSKAQGGNPTLDDIFGSGAFSRGAEVILGIRQLEPGLSRLYIWKHRPGELDKGTHIDLTFDRDSGFTKTYHQSMKTTLTMIEEMLAREPQGLTLKEIGKRMDKSEGAIRTVVSRAGVRIVSEKVLGSNKLIYKLGHAVAESMTIDDEQLKKWEDLVA